MRAACSRAFDVYLILSDVDAIFQLFLISLILLVFLVFLIFLVFLELIYFYENSE